MTDLNKKLDEQELLSLIATQILEISRLLGQTKSETCFYMLKALEEDSLSRGFSEEEKAKIIMDIKERFSEIVH